MRRKEERAMRKSLVLGAAALLALAGTALTPSDAEARWRGGGFGVGGFRGGGFHGGAFRGGGFYGGGFRAAGFARPAFGGYGWRGGYPRFGGYGYWGGYPRYGYYRRGWGYGGGALAAGLIGGAILGAGLSAATTCDLYSGWGCSYGYGYAYPAYYGYGYPAETVVIRRTYYGY
jgi:hypothetical protein